MRISDGKVETRNFTHSISKESFVVVIAKTPGNVKVVHVKGWSLLLRVTMNTILIFCSQFKKCD